MGVEPEWEMYVLKCRDGTFYTGICRSLERRVAEHNSGRRGAKYTRSRRPVSLLAHWGFPDKPSALRAERAFKKLNRKQKEQKIEDSNHRDL